MNLNLLQVLSIQQAQILALLDDRTEAEKREVRQHERRKEFRKLQLENDIYCLAFVYFHYCDSAMEADKLVLKCCITFVMQMSLLASLFYQHCGLEI